MNDQNLKPKPITSVEQAKSMGRKGGIASAKARKDRAVISAMYAKFLAKKTKVNIDGKPATGVQLFEYAVTTIISKGSDSAKVALMKEVREALEGSKVAITGAIIETNYRDLTDEQKAVLRAANEALLEVGL
jgi:predicted nucleotide-binding protein